MAPSGDRWEGVAPGVRVRGSPADRRSSVDVAAIRFEPIELPDTGTIIGVRLAGGERSRGDERHFWAALAPFVEAGSHMDWYGEDDAVWRWRFTGERMIHIDGTLAFDE